MIILSTSSVPDECDRGEEEEEAVDQHQQEHRQVEVEPLNNIRVRVLLIIFYIFVTRN